MRNPTIHIAACACALSLAFFTTLPNAGAWEAGATTQAAEAINSAGLKIFAEAAKEPGNLCISPFSIQSALMMTYQGASGETEAQMGKALDLGEPGAMADSYGQLISTMGVAGENSKKFTFSVANRLFGSKTFTFRPEFLATCKNQFGAPLEATDFEADPDAATLKINTWVEDQTAGKISDLIPSGAIDRTTALVLVNALYLKAQWAEEFQPAGTMDFRADGETQAKVEAIRQTGPMVYKKTDGFTTVACALEKNMMVAFFLPDKATEPMPPMRKDLLESLTMAKMAVASVNLTLPKFRIESPSISLKDILTELGMPSAFDNPIGSADFDAMAPKLPDQYLYISDVFHKTFFDLNEAGIEAAAATAVVMALAGAAMDPEEPVQVTLDRPFYFAVWSSETNALLFLGRVTNPGGD